jgi:hypothetical protein
MTKARDDKGSETKANTRATTRAVARTKASEPMAKTNEDEMAEATNGHSTEVREDALAKTNNTEAAETREDAGIETEQDIRIESKEDGVAVNIYNFQKLSTEQLESNTSAASSFLDTLQAIAAEASNYSRRSLENRSSFVVKMFSATTFESAIQIQSEHAKTSYAGFIAYLMKMTDLRANLAREFLKPIETAITKVQTSSANDA